MKNNIAKYRLRSMLPTIIILVAMLPKLLAAAPWEYGVNIDFGAIYTDNVFLGTDGQEEGESVYTIAPEFYLKTDGDRIDANIRYKPEAYFYDENSDADDIFHIVDAQFNSQLVRDKFFLALSGSQFQSIVTSNAQFPTTNIPISNNRVDSRTLTARPYWQQRVGAADLLLGVSYSDVDYDDDNFENSQITRGQFELDNKRRQQGFAWGVGYDYVKSEYDVSLPWEYQRAALDLGFWVTSTTRLFGVVGAESDVSQLRDLNFDEDFWEAGLQYRPSDRLNLEFAAGDRSYGTSFRFDLDYKLKRGNTSLSYNEGPSTGARLPLGRRPIDDTDNLDGILDEPGRSDRFIRRRLQWLTSIELAKSDLTIRLFGELRDQRSSDDGMPLDDEELAGIALRWSWRLGVNTTFGVGADVSSRDNVQRNDDLSRFQMNLRYDFSEKLSLRAEVMHAKQRGNESNQNDYDENQIRLFLRTEF